MILEKAPVFYDPFKTYEMDIDHFRTGDLCMTLWIDPDMSLKDRIMVGGITRTTGAFHNHDEPLIRQPDGLYVGYATPPHYIIVPFSKRLQEFEEGKRVFAIFRWHSFMLPGHKGYHEAFQESACASIKTLGALQVPYDRAALDHILMLKIFNNFARRFFKLENVEHNVYCTEGFVLVYNVCGVDVLYPVGEQKYPSPIHTERLWRMGYFAMIADFGLRKYLMPGLEQTKADGAPMKSATDELLDAVSPVA